MRPFERSRRDSALPRDSLACTCSLTRSPAISGGEVYRPRLHFRRGATAGTGPGALPALEELVLAGEDGRHGFVREHVLDRVREQNRDRQRLGEVRGAEKR